MLTKDVSDCSIDNISDSTDNVDNRGNITIHLLLPDSTADDPNSEEVTELGLPEQTLNKTETARGVRSRRGTS